MVKICFAPLDFDKRVNDNKTAAEEALKKIPAISQTIAEANNKTQQAELALGNAAADAREAKARADDAEKIASSVQKVGVLQLTPLRSCWGIAGTPVTVFPGEPPVLPAVFPLHMQNMAR